MTEFSKIIMQIGILGMLLFLMSIASKYMGISFAINTLHYWTSVIVLNYFAVKLTEVYNAIVYQVYLPQKQKTP